MTIGLKILGDDGRVALTSDYKSFVFMGKYEPFQVQTLNGLASIIRFRLPRLENNIIPFLWCSQDQARCFWAVNPDYDLYSGYTIFSYTNATTVSYFIQNLSQTPLLGLARVYTSQNGATVSRTITAVGTPTPYSYQLTSPFSMTISGYLVSVTFDSPVTITGTNNAGAQLYTGLSYIFMAALVNSGGLLTSDYAFYVFKEVDSAVGSGFGMRVFDDTGTGILFDSNQMVLKVAGSARAPQILAGQKTSLGTITLDSGTIPTKHAIWCASMGRYDRMADNPSPWHTQYSVERQAIGVQKYNSSTLLIQGAGCVDRAVLTQNYPSFVPTTCPGGSQILVIDASLYD